jgi:hypothetical protein
MNSQHQEVAKQAISGIYEFFEDCNKAAVIIIVADCPISPILDILDSPLSDNSLI